MKESRELFSLKENEQISRSELFDRYMKLLKEYPERKAEIFEAFKTISGGNVITYPPVQARQLVKNIAGLQEVSIANWYTSAQDAREEISYIKSCIDELLEEEFLMMKKLKTIFYLTRSLEKQLENISHPALRETYINYLKMVDSKLKRNYELEDAENMIIRNTKGQRKK